jgi:titin
MVLEWSEPSSDGGCPLDGYTVEYRAEGSKRWMTANAEPVGDCRFIVKNLLEDIGYEFRVIAQNKAGPGEHSQVSSPAKITPQRRKQIITLIFILKYSLKHPY